MFIRVCGGRKKSEKFVSTKGTISVTTNISGASIKITSTTSGSSVVIDDAFKDKTYTTTKLAPGEYEVVVTKEGYDPYKTTVKVNGDVTVEANLKESIVTGATATVTNALVDYKNTVLVNDNAIVTVNVKDSEGKAVAGKTVVFSIDQIQKKNLAGEALDDSAPNKLEIKGEVVKTTDANGNATFIVGLKNATKDCTKEDHKASAKFTAKVLGVEDETKSATDGCVGFAALDLTKVKVNPDDVKPNAGKLEAGESAGGKNVSGISKTKSLIGKDVEYLSTQKVSSEGKDEHEVTFDAKPIISLPDMGADEVSKDYVQLVNEKSGDYFTYANYDKVIKVNVDTRKLQYATLMFNDIEVSKYTKLVITPCSDAEGKTPLKKVDSYVIKGEHSQKGFGYQIPLNEGETIKSIKVSLKSGGQVQTNMNSGFDIDKIVGVYKANASTDGTTEEVKNAKIDWENVEPVMSDLVKLTGDAANAFATAHGINTFNSTNGGSLDYQVPAFPYTGDAVIREFDKNGKVINYYLAPTVKATGANNTNTNIIEADAKAYKATYEEATTHKVGDIKTEGNLVKINSTKVGASNLKGTISLPTLVGDGLDASNKYVYTSVQWNPIPKSSSSDAFLALSGQNITVKAQITDKNGNPVSESGKDIKYTYAGNYQSFNSNETLKNIKDNIAVVKNESTDVHGQATLVLSAGDKNSLTGLSATCTDSNYNVKLIVGGQNTLTDTADLYWINANLKFRDTVDGPDYITEDTTNGRTVDVEVSKPTAATPWRYAVQTVGNKLTDGVLKDSEVNIKGLKVQTSFDTENKGKYKVVEDVNGAAEGTSDYKNKDVIINKLTSASIGDKVVFEIGGREYPCVGEGGTPNLNARMNLNVDWGTTGTALTLINPDGTNIADGTTKVYVKVTDGTGKNPLKKTRVTFKSSNVNDTFVETDITDNFTTPNVANDGVVYTNDDGIAVVELTKAAGVASSVITASVDNVEQVATKTINWVAAQPYFGVVGASMVDGAANQVELTFNNEVLASSVRTDLFDVKAKVGSKDVHYEVKEAKADGRRVILTMSEKLDPNEYTVEIGNTTKDSVVYALKDETGADLGNGLNDVIFSSTKKATYNVGVSARTNSNLVTVSDIKAPFELTGNSDEFAKYFTVVVDGKIGTFTEVNGDIINGVNVAGGYKVGYDTVNNAYIFSIPFSAKDQDVTVYFMGENITKKIDANEAKKTEADKKVKFNKTVAAVDAYFASTTNGDIDLSKLAEEGNTITINSTLGGDGAAAGTVDATKVKLDKTNAAYVENKTITMDVTITDDATTLNSVKKQYKLTIGKDAKSYEIVDVDEAALKTDVDAFLTTIKALDKDSAILDAPTNVATTGSRKTSVAKEDVKIVEDYMGILSVNESDGKLTINPATAKANATATFSITYKHAYQGSGADTIVAELTKTYKVTVNAAGTDFTVTEA